MKLIFLLSAVISCMECRAAGGTVCNFHNSSDGSGEDVKFNEWVEGTLPLSLFLLFIATLATLKSAIKETDSVSVPPRGGRSSLLLLEDEGLHWLLL